jgi:hypothetical protein
MFNGPLGHLPAAAAAGASGSMRLAPAFVAVAGDVRTRRWAECPEARASRRTHFVFF